MAVGFGRSPCVFSGVGDKTAASLSWEEGFSQTGFDGLTILAHAYLQRQHFNGRRGYTYIYEFGYKRHPTPAPRFTRVKGGLMILFLSSPRAEVGTPEDKTPT